MRWTSLGGALALGVLMGAAANCKGVNERHCANSSGNIDCQNRFGTELPFCSKCDNGRDDSGCVAEMPTPDCLPFSEAHCAAQPAGVDPNEYCAAMFGQPICNGCRDENNGCEPDRRDPDHCYVGGGTGTGTDTSASTGGSMGSSGDATMGSSTTVGPACMNDAECTDPMFPACDGMNCVPCTAGGGDAACAAKDPALPACTADGRCVQCTDVELSLCTDNTPACDQDTNTCRACQWHSECPQSACHLAGPDVGACFDEVPVPASTAMALAAAISAITSGEQGVVVVSGGTLSQNIDVNPGAEVAIIAPVPVTIVGGLGDGFTANAGSLVYVSGLEIRSWTGEGVDASGDEIWLDRVVVARNDQIGVNATNTNLVMRLSSVGRNGDTGLASPGVSVSGGSANILYSSIVANESNGPRSLFCSGSPSGTVRNSILVAQATPSVACMGVTLTNNALDQMVANNVNVGFMGSWFVDFVNGDARLVGMPTMLQVASWEDGDPITDFDGTDIPQMGMSYAGFDQP